MSEKWLTKECAELLSNMMTCAEVKAAIKSAVLAEREACAKVCDGLAIDFPIGSSNCATAIRARGEK